MAATQFWVNKSLAELTQQQWESLCDGCGKCCLHKLEDEENGDVYYTRVACQYLDLESCRCSDYDNRLTNVPQCLKLTPDMLGDTYWLPITCAYRLLAEGAPLPDWHPLVSGDSNTVHQAGISVASFAIAESKVEEHDMEEQIINWVI